MDLMMQSKKGKIKGISAKASSNQEHSSNRTLNALGLYDPKGVKEGIIRTERSPEDERLSASTKKPKSPKKSSIFETWEIGGKVKGVKLKKESVTLKLKAQDENKNILTESEIPCAAKVKTLLDPSMSVVAQVKKIAYELPAIDPSSG